MGTRVAYLERDPALRGFILKALGEQPEVLVTNSYETTAELIGADLGQCDVVLLDLDLGPLSIDGIEMGLFLRRRSQLGVVLFTAAPLPDLAEALPPAHRRGWSVVRKSTEVDVSLLARTLVATTKGLNVVDPSAKRLRSEEVWGVRMRLTERQRAIMSLAAEGCDVSTIAANVGLAPITVRQEMSKAYAVLVPHPRVGIDVRTLAVIRFLRSGASVSISESAVS